MYEKLDAALEALRSDVIDTLSKWIKIPSEKQAACENAPFGQPIRDMLDTALADAARLGLKTRDFDGYAGDAEIGEGEEVMGILAHLDVVPAGDGWVQDPFGAEIINGKMYGRGTSDDKGPAVAALFAMKAVLDAGIPLKRRVRLILGCDEESGWECMNYYAAHEKMPDFGFSPDASYPVINTEKGIEGMNLRASFTGEENAKYPLYSASAGQRANVIPGLATAEIGCEDYEELKAALEKICAEKNLDVKCEKLENGHVRLISTGVTGHAAMPHLGKNAAGQLLVAMSALGVGGGCRSFIDCLAEKIGMESNGASMGISGSDAISGALTLNLGILRITPESGCATLNIRYPVLFDYQQIAKIMQMTVKEAGISVEDVGCTPPLHVPASTFIVSNLLKVYHDVTGLDAYTIAIGGGTYSRAMDNCVAFGASFPDDEDLAHIAGECVELDKLMLSARIFAHAIVNMAS